MVSSNNPSIATETAMTPGAGRCETGVDKAIRIWNHGCPLNTEQQ
jgi:hypothetical protein